MTFRPQFIAGLEILARASEEMERRGFPRPIVVGGAAVEFYTVSGISSGDFDVVSPAQQALEEILLKLGFERPSGSGALMRGLINPRLGMGFEVVSGSLMDGMADSTKIWLVDLDGGEVCVTPIEDLIADRLGQFAAVENGPREMLDQAIALFRLADELDFSYLDKRIKEETVGACSLRFLEERAKSS